MLEVKVFICLKVELYVGSFMFSYVGSKGSYMVEVRVFIYGKVKFLNVGSLGFHMQKVWVLICRKSMFFYMWEVNVLICFKVGLYVGSFICGKVGFLNVRSLGSHMQEVWVLICRKSMFLYVEGKCFLYTGG